MRRVEYIYFGRNKTRNTACVASCFLCVETHIGKDDPAIQQL